MAGVASMCPDKDSDHSAEIGLQLLLEQQAFEAECRTQHSRTCSSLSGHVDPTTLPLENFSITQTPLLQTLQEPSPLHPQTTLPWQTQQVREFQQLQLTSLHTPSHLASSSC